MINAIATQLSVLAFAGAGITLVLAPFHQRLKMFCLKLALVGVVLAAAASLIGRM